MDAWNEEMKEKQKEKIEEQGKKWKQGEKTQRKNIQAFVLGLISITEWL